MTNDGMNLTACVTDGPLVDTVPSLSVVEKFMPDFVEQERHAERSDSVHNSFSDKDNRDG